MAYVCLCFFYEHSSSAFLVCHRFLRCITFTSFISSPPSSKKKKKERSCVNPICSDVSVALTVLPSLFLTTGKDPPKWREKSLITRGESDKGGWNSGGFPSLRLQEDTGLSAFILCQRKKYREDLYRYLMFPVKKRKKREIFSLEEVFSVSSLLLINCFRDCPKKLNWTIN